VFAADKETKKEEAIATEPEVDPATTAAVETATAALQAFTDAAAVDKVADKDKQAAAKTAVEAVAGATWSTGDDAKMNEAVVDAIAAADKKITESTGKVYFRLKAALNAVEDSVKEADAFKNSEAVRAALGTKLSVYGCGPEPDAFMGIPLLCGMMG
jgi:hypothetical protein